MPRVPSGSLFHNVLVGIDELEAGRDPVALARQLSGPRTHLALVRVHGAHPGGESSALSNLHAAQARSARAALDRARRLTGVSDTLSLGAMSVGDGLRRAAAQRRVDLLVIGSGHHGEPGVVDVSGWTAELLSRAPCPVAVAPLGYAARTEPIHRIGVAFDDSTESRHALMLGRHLAADLQARLWVGEAPRFAREHAHDVGVRVASELAEFSAEVDLLILGPRGAGPLRRILHPSATLALMHSARSPLLLVTHQSRVPAEVEAPPDEVWRAAAAKPERLIP